MLGFLGVGFGVWGLDFGFGAWGFWFGFVEALAGALDLEWFWQTLHLNAPVGLVPWRLLEARQQSLGFLV